MIAQHKMAALTSGIFWLHFCDGGSGHMSSVFLTQMMVSSHKAQEPRPHLVSCFQDDALSITDMTSLQAPLDIPIPDPPSPEDEVRPFANAVTQLHGF